MRGSRPINSWCHALLTLIVLVGNIFAPFRTASIGRAFLENLTHNTAHHSVVRVRAVTSFSTSLGHRAVVGCSRGGPDVAETGTRPSAFSTFLATPTDTPPRRQSAGIGLRPTPRLRC